MFAMAKLMGMETTEQNKVALYLFNNIKTLKETKNVKIIFDKTIKKIYNKNRNESHRQCVLPIY